MTAVDDAPPVAVDPTISEAERVDRAVSAVAELDPTARAVAGELKAAIENFHREPLVHIVQTLRADPRGKELLFDLVDDERVHALFVLHGIVKVSPVAAALRALDTVRPYLQSHGGDVELVGVVDGVASVRLHGSCNGCSMSSVTLREGVEEALVRLVDEIDEVRVLDDEPTAAFIPLGSVGRKRDEHGWQSGPVVDEVAPGTMTRFDHGDDSFVITNVDNRLAAFRNECVHQGQSLDGGVLDEGVLVCPWHGFRFDASSGECLSAPGAQLTGIPLRIDQGRVWLRVE